MSKHSMRRGSAGSCSACCSRSSASYLRDARRLVAGAIGELGVAGRQVDQAAPVAALRHARFGPCVRPAPTATPPSRRRPRSAPARAPRAAAPALRRTAAAPLRRPPPRARRQPRWAWLNSVDPLDDPAAPHLEHLDDRAAIARPSRRTRRGRRVRRLAIFCWRSPSACTARIASRVLRRLLEPLRRRGGVASCARRARRPAPRCGPRARADVGDRLAVALGASRARRRTARGSA